MTAKRNSIPELRLSGFAGDWEETPMGELLSFKNGYNAGKEQYGTGKKFINVLDIIENDYITHDRIIGQVDIPPKDFEKNEVKFGDILFQRSSETREEVGQANVYLDQNKLATFGGFVIRGRPLCEFNPVFFNAMLKTAKVRKDITSRSGGSTRYNIGQESLEQVLVSIAPTLPEQRKIADFLTAVDGRIGQLIQKKALLEDYKKGVMQQLFTQAIRFKDNQGNDFPDWEEKKLGEVADVRDGTHESPKYQSSGLPLVTSKNLMKNGSIDMENVDLISKEDFQSINKRSLVEAGDIVFGMIGTIGNPVIVSEAGFAIKNVALIKEQKHLTNKYLIHYLDSEHIARQFYVENTGGTQKFIALGVIRKLLIQSPSLPEQTKIANFLSALDRKIESVATQITETQTFKRGLLQQMFV